MLVTGLKAIGKSVAVTGSGINDVEALQAADVGLAMGSGCSAAKEAADLVLTDNDFEATLRSVMWGRNIYHNVSRFLQFQVTVNIYNCYRVHWRHHLRRVPTFRSATPLDQLDHGHLCRYRSFN